jgi:hypothetical protein
VKSRATGLNAFCPQTNNEFLSYTLVERDVNQPNCMTRLEPNEGN